MAEQLGPGRVSNIFFLALFTRPKRENIDEDPMLLEEQSSPFVVLVERVNQDFNCII